MKPILIEDITRLLQHISALNDLKKNGLEITYRVDEKNFKALDEELFYANNKSGELTQISFRPSTKLEIEVNGIVAKVVK